MLKSFTFPNTVSIVTGSYNWSANAEDNNDENAVFIRNSSVIAVFQSNFNTVWSSR